MHTIYMPEPDPNHKIAGQQISDAKCSEQPLHVQPRPVLAASHAEEMSPTQIQTQAAFQTGGQAGGMLHSVFAESITRAAYYARDHREPVRPWGKVLFNRVDQRRAWEATGGRCYYCGIQTIAPAPSVAIDCRFAAFLDVDHILSRKLGGKSNKENLRPSCSWCNQTKRGHTIEHFRRLFAAKHGSPFFYGEVAA